MPSTSFTQPVAFSHVVIVAVAEVDGGWIHNYRRRMTTKGG